MATQKNFKDHDWVLRQLEALQEADSDSRDRARDAHAFVDEPHGQWETSVWDDTDGRPRYQFDLVDPIIDQVSGDIERSDFDIRISPAGGDATKDTAKTYDGVVRNIETISGANATYNAAARNVATAGLDGWRVRHDYSDDNSFHQDLLIEGIPNYLDRVWHGPHQKPDASDAEYCYVITWLEENDYKAQYPDRPEMSLETDNKIPAYYGSKQDMTAVGEFYYLKDVERELILMTSGQVFEDDEEYAKVKDELAAAGIAEEKRRTRTKRVVCVRQFDAAGWIDEPADTVFENWIPVVPMYGNFKVNNNVIRYRGVVQKLKDPQRVFNYAKSREIEEGALAPREKILATLAMAEGQEEAWAELNTSADPVMFWSPDPDAPGQMPTKIMGPQINPGLTGISASMQQIVGQTAGMFAANMGDNPGLQSGKAIEALQDRGDVGNNKYIAAREVSQAHTARILVNAIPRVYTPGRQVRLLKEDESYDMAIIGERIFDKQSETWVVLNDLSVGAYDVACTSGPSFKNRQNETVRAFTELGQYVPGIIETNQDLLLSNIPAPGMDQAARRARLQLFTAGGIPDEDLSEEEMQLKQEMDQQPPKESPEMVLARAEEVKGQADLADAQTKQTQVQGEMQIKVEEIKLKQKDLEVRFFEAQTDRYKAEIDAARAKADVQGKGASAAKALAEAEAQDIENDAVLSNLDSLFKGGMSG